MHLNDIKKALKYVNEDKHPGLKRTEKVQKEEDKFNKDNQKEVKKKMKDYDSAAKQEDENAIDEPKTNAEGEEKEYHDDMEIRNGQEMLQYDSEPSKRFKERAEMALKGDSKMGNEVKTGKWNPETGEGNGNTESVWGASKDDYGQDLVDDIKRSAKKRQDAKQTIVQFGDDIELSDRPAKKRKVAVEHTDNKVANNKTMKRLTFKKPFNGMGNALNLIPEHMKEDGKVFEMTDLNESYVIRWENDHPQVLRANSKKMMNEDIQKMKHLMGYNSEDTLGTLKGQERIQENASFGKVFEMTKQMMNESEVANAGDVLTEEVIGSILYKAATWKPINESEEIEETRDMESVDAPEALPAEEEVGSTGVNEAEDMEGVNSKEGDWDDAANGSGDGHAEHVMEDDDLLEYVEMIPEAEEVTEGEKEDMDGDGDIDSDDYIAKKDAAIKRSVEETLSGRKTIEESIKDLSEELGLTEEEIMEGLGSFLKGPSKEDQEANRQPLMQQAQKIAADAEAKGWKVGYLYEKQPLNSIDELMQAAAGNKFRGKIVPRPIKAKGTLYIEYVKGLSGLQKLAGGSGSITAGA